MKNKLMSEITKVIETLEAWEEYYEEQYNEKLSEYTQLKDSEEIKKNECEREGLQGRIIGIKIALSMLK